MTQGDILGSKIRPRRESGTHTAGSVFEQTLYPEARLILDVARSIVSRDEPREAGRLIKRGNIRWEEFNRLVFYHELFSFGHIFFRELSETLPKEETKLLSDKYYECVSYLFCLIEEFKRIAGVFNEQKIMCVPLKGTAFLMNNMYAEKSYLRPMGDIDILVRKADFPLVEVKMESLGYKKDLMGLKESYWKDKGYHLGFRRQGDGGFSYLVEVHWALDYPRNRPILSSLWDRIHKVDVEGLMVCFLSPEDTLFSLALHQRRFGKMLCLKNSSDAAFLIGKHGPGLDWDYLLREADVGKMRLTLYFMLMQAKILLGTPIPSFALEALKVPGYKRWLIKQFITKYAFAYGLGLPGSKINIKSLYLRNHFLIYDTIWEPLIAAFNAPKEQFSNFYGLEAYNKKTALLYFLRFFYIPLRGIPLWLK